MKILLLGRKEVTSKLLIWTIKQGHEIVGVVTDNHLLNSQTAKTAKDNNIPIFELDEIYRKIISNEFVHFDIAISVLYWKKIKEPLISYPKYGIINIHPAPLPQFKGTAGYNLAILNNLSSWAITAHYIDEGIDTGPIIKVLEFEINQKNETAQSLEKKSRIYIKKLYKNILNKVVKSGFLNSYENKGGVYISRKEMEKMKRIEIGDDIDRKIRAFWFPPYDGAYIEIDGKKYTLINDFILGTLAEKNTTSLFTSTKSYNNK